MHLIFIEQLIQDIRFSCRSLRKNFAFSLVAVLTLALGIGANTAIFSVVYSTLIRPLPYPRSSELMWVADDFRRMKVSFVPHPSYFGWREKNHVFSGLAAFDASFDCNLIEKEDAQRASGVPVSANFFAVLGVNPEFGRGFLEAEDIPGGPAVVVLTHTLWVDRFDANRSILGGGVNINGRDFTVIGVLPAGFRFPSARVKPDLFIPLGLTASLNGSAIHKLHVIGRLRHGESVETADTNISVLEASQLKLYPGWFSRYSQGSSVDVVPLHETLVRDVRPAFMTLTIVVGFVLLIGCANIANLQLVRAAMRYREVAVRAVLGATRTRLVRQLFTESGILTSIGGIAGIGAALITLGTLRSLVSATDVALPDIRMSAMVFTFALIVTVITGVLTGLAPSLVASSPDLNRALREGDARGGSVWARNFRSVLVVGELTAAVILLTCAGMLLKSFLHLREVPLGFSSKSLLTAQISLSGNQYPGPIQQSAFFGEALDRVSALPGVRTAAVADRIPPDGPAFGTRIAIEGQPAPAPNDVMFSIIDIAVSPGYFRALGIPLILGRDFSRDDERGTPGVIIVNQAFARRFFPGSQKLLGQHVLYPAAGGMTPLEIVGVVSDYLNVGIVNQPAPEMYRPFLQRPASSMYVVMATDADPSSLVSALRTQVRMLDKSSPVYDVRTMEQILEADAGPQKFIMTMTVLFAGLALLLAGVGIYGVVSDVATQRTHEIGIRMALGASKSHGMRLIISQAATWVVFAMILGLAGTLSLSHFLSSLLFDVQRMDGLSFLYASILLFCVTVLASYVPGRRATRVDPAIALRQG